MNNVIIGTAGHVDHGKTCLIKALTGIETDRLAEEKKRGITIELGFAHLDTPDGGRIGIVDVPGHERFIRNMLAGAGGIDLALLIVAADEGIMPQTIEHLGILSLLGLKRGIIVMTKIDTVDEDWRAMIREDIRAQVKDTFLEEAPIAEVSAYTGEGIEALKGQIIEMAEHMAGKKTRVPFRIPVDRVFTMEGFGTVITGTMIEGTLRRGDEVTVYPDETPGKVRTLQVHGASVDEAVAGQRVAVNLQGLKKTEIKRGDVLAEPGSMQATMMVDVRLNALKESGRIIKNGSRLHFYHGAREVLCKAVLLDREQLEPGQSGYAQLRLEESVALKAGDSYIVRFYSPLETVGGGVVLDPAPLKRKRNDEQVLAGLRLKESGGERDRLEQAIREGSPMFKPLSALCLQYGFEREWAEREAEALAAGGAAAKAAPGVYLHMSYLDKQGEKLSQLLRKYHTENPLKEGMRREELRSRFLPGQEQAVADGLLDYYARAGRIKIVGGLVSVFAFKVKLDEGAAKARQAIETIYREAGYAPPATDEVIEQVGRGRQTEQVLSAMIADGTLKRLDAQICFHKEHYEKAVGLIKERAAAQGQITLAECRDLLGTSRKFAIAVLEVLDREKVTKKVGDYRVLA